MLIALLLPAVQQAREAARRAACKNNLKQLTLGLHNHESTYRQLPAGYQHRFGSDGSPANHLGFAWGRLILPQIEDSNFYERFNLKVPVFDPVNQEPGEHHLPVFLCPSDSYSDGQFVVRDENASPVERYAAGSYAANWGPSTATVNLDDTPLESQGVFYRNSSTRFGDITDGRSKTLALGERTNGPISTSQPTAGGHSFFENAWCGAAREVTDPADDHGHMVPVRDAVSAEPNRRRRQGAFRAPRRNLPIRPLRRFGAANQREHRSDDLQPPGHPRRRRSGARLLRSSSTANRFRANFADRMIAAVLWNAVGSHSSRAKR